MMLDDRLQNVKLTDQYPSLAEIQKTLVKIVGNENPVLYIFHHEKKVNAYHL